MEIFVLTSTLKQIIRIHACRHINTSVFGILKSEKNGVTVSKKENGVSDIQLKQ